MQGQYNYHDDLWNLNGGGLPFSPGNPHSQGPATPSSHNLGPGTAPSTPQTHHTLTPVPTSHSTNNNSYFVPQVTLQFFITAIVQCIIVMNHKL